MIIRVLVIYFLFFNLIERTIPYRNTILTSNKVPIMLKNNILIFTLVLILSACATDKPRLLGIDGSEIPPAFANFPDIPFPDKAYINLEETKALGSGENWIGSLVYEVPYNASSVFDFYVLEMPKLKWIEVAIVRAKISHMTYVRNNRAVQILVQQDGADSAVVTITAIPNQSRIN